MLICSVIADAMLLLSIMLINKNIFKYKQHYEACKTFNLIITAICVIVISVAINTGDNLLVGSFVYLCLVCVLTYRFFEDNWTTIIISSIWTIVILEMLDKMSVILFDMVEGIIGKYNLGVAKLARACILLVFVIIIGRLYNKRYSKGLKSVGKGALIAFTILAIVDTFIVMIISNAITVSVGEVKQRVNYIAFILVILGLFLQLGAVILIMVQRNVYKESQQLTEKYLEEQKSHYEYLEKRETETKKFRHDLRSHVEMLTVLAKKRQYDKFDKYVEEINVNIDRFGNNVTVQNGIVDAIINKYYSEAIANDVTMEVKGRFPSDCKIDAYHLCTIFSNILSNAIEATIEAEKKWISVFCKYTDDNILVEVKNTFDSKNAARNGKLRTHKKDANNHGFGLENVKESISKYDGLWGVDIQDNIYTITISFNYVRQEGFYENSDN